MNPSSNLLAQALTVIAPSPITWYACTGRSLNAVRQWVSTFDEGVVLRGSVQAVPRSRYQALGLDFQKQYINIFTTTNIASVGRDASGDQFSWNGKRYEIPNKTDWIIQDKWNEVMAVEVST